MYAYNQSVGPQKQKEHAGEIHSTGTQELPAEARSLHARLYDDAEEAELGSAQGSSCSLDEQATIFRSTALF